MGEVMAECDSISVTEECRCGVVVEFHDTVVKALADALDEWRLLHECDAMRAAINRMEGFVNE